MLLCAAAPAGDGVMNEVHWLVRNVDHGPVSITAAVTGLHHAGLFVSRRMVVTWRL